MSEFDANCSAHMVGEEVDYAHEEEESEGSEEDFVLVEGEESILVVAFQILAKPIANILGNNIHHIAVTLFFSDGAEICYDYGPMENPCSQDKLMSGPIPGMVLIRPPPAGFHSWSGRVPVSCTLSRDLLHDVIDAEASHRQYCFLAKSTDSNVWNCILFAEWLLALIKAPSSEIDRIKVHDMVIDFAQDMQSMVEAVSGTARYSQERCKGICHRIRGMIYKTFGPLPKLSKKVSRRFHRRARKVKKNIRNFRKSAHKFVFGGRSSSSEAKSNQV